MRDERILYVSDLDGTLLNSDQTLSEFTVNTINRLVEQGMIFSYATARSYHTAGIVTQGISPKIPVIVYNGAFVLNNGTRQKLLSHFFEPKDARYILNLLTDNSVYPIVYSYIDNIEKFSYCKNRTTKGMNAFLESRKGDNRDNPVELSELYKGEAFYFTCIDTAEKLLPIYNLCKNTFQCIYQKDIYSGEQWLEILPKQASKANAVLELKKLLNCNKAICFGDGKNDISMFDISDECYAVENADSELKDRATAVIQSNNDDGVARWLLDRHEKEQNRHRKNERRHRR